MEEKLKKPFVIADIGSNWRLSDDPGQQLKFCFHQIEEAARAGVSAVKFQLFTHEDLYGTPGEDTYSLPREFLPDLKRHATANGVEFMCTAISPDGVTAVDPYVSIHKIASAEMSHLGILAAVIATHKPFIVSTGGATADDIANLVEDVSAINDWSLEDLYLLQCVAAYPAEPSDYHLRAKNAFGFSGISDHTMGLAVACAGVGRGLRIFEKHFDAYGGGSGYPETPDSPHSISAAAMRDYVDAIHEAHAALGDGTKYKEPKPSEAGFVKYARRERSHGSYRRKP